MIIIILLECDYHGAWGGHLIIYWNRLRHKHRGAGNQGSCPVDDKNLAIKQPINRKKWSGANKCYTFCLVDQFLLKVPLFNENYFLYNTFTYKKLRQAIENVKNVQGHKAPIWMIFRFIWALKFCNCLIDDNKEVKNFLARIPKSNQKEI